MTKTKELRGHHLGTLFYDYHRNGSIGQYAETLYAGMVLITASSNDEICSGCDQSRREKCSSAYVSIDHEMAKAFGLEVGNYYDFASDIMPKIVGGIIDRRILELVTAAQGLESRLKPEVKDISLRSVRELSN